MESIEEKNGKKTALNGIVELGSAIIVTLMIIAGGTTSTIVTIYLLLFTSYWYIPLIYLTWEFLDRNTPSRGGRMSEVVRNLRIWKYFIDYFPMRLVVKADLSPEKNYLFVSHPHGIVTLNSFANFLNNHSEFRKRFVNLNTYLATLNVNVSWPLVRNFFLAIGAVSASRESLEYVLDPKKKGNVVLLVLGGALEALYSRPGVYRLILRRKGYVRLALKTGCSLVPVFAFGEVDIYDQISNPEGSLVFKVQQWIMKLTGIAIFLPYGRGGFFPAVIPKRVPVTTVVGEPIDVPKIDNPTKEQINHYYKLYVKNLKDLFYENRSKYIKNSENAELIIE